MNIFDLKRNDRNWELVNISNDEATGIHFQLNRMIAEGDGVNRHDPAGIEVCAIESLKPGEGATLTFGERFWALALMRTETDERKRKLGKIGYCLKIFFTHPLDESQITSLWEK